MRDFEKYLKQSEQQTITKTVDALLAAGFEISVDDGEQITVKRSTDKETILGAMGTTEEDYLRVGRANENTFGWVRFVYGNEDWVAICDHTTNLEAILQPVFDWMDMQTV